MRHIEEARYSEASFHRPAARLAFTPAAFGAPSLYAATGWSRVYADRRQLRATCVVAAYETPNRAGGRLAEARPCSDPAGSWPKSSLSSAYYAPHASVKPTRGLYPGVSAPGAAPVAG